jgi:predicted 3-demethylubiquinone-9 3-methyltransferase (glyoxalase superfamily)
MIRAPFPCLWFDGNGRAAADFYCAVFPESRVLQDNGIVVSFELMGQQFMALNGGPRFPHSEAVSFVISCDTQDEIDHFWHALCEGGEESRCGWLKDRFGISWQVVPAAMGEWMSDPKRAARVMEACMPMNKLILADLERAANAGL